MIIEKKSKNLVFLVSPLRAGSVLLQSYLDNHSEIMMVPNVFFFFNFIESEFDLNKSFKKNLDNFCNYKKHEPLFDSRKSYILGRGLGENKTDTIKVNLEKFKFEARKFMKNIEFNFYTFYHAIHFSFVKNIYEKNEPHRSKIVFHHIHNLDILPLAKSYFPESKVITMVRDPFKSFESAVRFNLLRGIPKYTKPYNWTLERYLEGWISISNNSFKNSWKIIKLESLRESPNEVLSGLMTWLGVNLDENLSISTMGGKLWWGDVFSQNAISGQTEIEPSKITGKISKNEIKIFETIGLSFIEKKNSKLNIFLSLIPHKNDIKEILSNLKIVFNLSPNKILLEEIDWDGFSPDLSKKRAIFDIILLPYRLLERYILYENASKKINKPFLIKSYYSER